MTEAQGFAAESTAHAKVLILGSMPGQASLAAQQYYAHPRNAFWSIMGSLFGAGPELDYSERVNILKKTGIALWDVLEFCERPGSLDSAIRKDTARANNFERFFQSHREIHTVFFNGKTASTLYRRHVTDPTRNLVDLPSTSPAHASMNLSEKLEQWSQVADALAAR